PRAPQSALRTHYGLLPTGDIDKTQELGARARVFAKTAEHLAGDHRHAGLVHAARGHALVARVDHHADAARLEHHVDAVGDLRRELLLHLEAPCVGFYDPRQLADPYHFVSRQVADVRAPDDRRAVML